MCCIDTCMQKPLQQEVFRASAMRDISDQGTHPCSQVALRQALILRMDVHQRLELRRAEQRLCALPRPRGLG